MELEDNDCKQEEQEEEIEEIEESQEDFPESDPMYYLQDNAVQMYHSLNLGMVGSIWSSSSSPSSTEEETIGQIGQIMERVVTASAMYRDLVQRGIRADPLGNLFLDPSGFLGNLKLGLELVSEYKNHLNTAQLLAFHECAVLVLRLYILGGYKREAFDLAKSLIDQAEAGRRSIVHSYLRVAEVALEIGCLPNNSSADSYYYLCKARVFALKATRCISIIESLSGSVDEIYLEDLKIWANRICGTGRWVDQRLDLLDEQERLDLLDEQVQ